MAKIYIGNTIISDDNTVKDQIIGAAPELLNTLDELAAALGDDENYATSTATSLSNRLRIDTDAQALDATQLVNAKTNLGLENVANESKATMFTDPTFTGTVSGLVGDGSGLTTLNATNISSGTLNKDRLPLATDITSIGTLSDLTVTGNVTGTANPTLAGHLVNKIYAETNFQSKDGTTGDVAISGDLAVDTDTLKVDSTNDRVGVNKVPERTFDMDGNFRLFISPENRVDGIVPALIKSTNKTGTNLRVEGPITVTHDLFKNSGVNNGFGDNSNHFHDITKINRISQQGTGSVKNIERVQEQYYAVESNVLRGSNAAFWNFGRVSRSIDNTTVSLSDLSGWNVQNIQDSTNRSNAGQVPFTQSETTTFTFNTTNPFTINDILQLTIDIDFEGPLVAATHFAKVTAVNGLSATVVLYNGSYKSTNEVDLSTSASPTPGNADPQTAITTGFSVTEIDTSTNILPSNGGFSAGDAFQRSFRSLLGSHGARTGRRVFKFNRNSVSDGLAVNDVLTIITTGESENGKSYKEAEVATVISVSSSQVYASYGRLFDNDPDLPLTYNRNKILAILKGSLDGLHRITTGDTLMNFNADNAGRYKSFQIGPGNEVDGNCIAIGKNVYNNVDKSIRIGYDPDSGSGDATNHLLITPTYTETLKPLSTTGIQAARISGQQTAFINLTYDAGIHTFRDFDDDPNDMMVIRKAASTTGGMYMPEAVVGINTNSPDAALHIVGQGARTDNVVLKAIGSGLFSSKNDLALHLKVDTDNSTAGEGYSGANGSIILKLQQDHTSNSGTNVERMNVGFIGASGGGRYTNSTANAAFIEVENNKPFEISTGGQKSLSISSSGNITTGGNLTVPGSLNTGNITTVGNTSITANLTVDKSIRPGVFADATARDAAIPSPQAGMMVFVTSGTKFQGYTGAAWVDLN